jgi:hypothetical protein
MNLRHEWMTYSGLTRCAYVLDGATQTLRRNGELIAEHVTYARDLVECGYPMIGHGTGSTITTGRAVGMTETVTS